MIFGRGLVSTSEDFGRQGKPPSHPQLLDWLARDFIESGWDLRHLFKQMVLSSTFRQKSEFTKLAGETDPENLLLSRGPSYRLPSEMIRDSALSVSGLLHHKVGGPGVKPYDLKLAFKPINPDRAPNVYRRSVYTFWKRTAMPPNMQILNAPSREESCVQRELTNTPLQAFVIMNDPQFVEASRQLAAAALQKLTTTEERINFIALTLLSREMETDEIDIIKTTLTTVLKEFKTLPEDAKKLISVGETKAPKNLAPLELAAWTVIANQILNMDEALNK
jgi:hypothetical protein